MGLFTRNKKPRSPEVQALADEGRTHSTSVHGDKSIHPDCKECMRIATAILKAHGNTPEEYLTYRLSRGDRPKMTNIAKALVAKAKGIVGSKGKETVH